MEISTAYLPSAVFAPAGADDMPRVFIAPQRYVQGKDVLGHMGRYLSLGRAARVAVTVRDHWPICSKGAWTPTRRSDRKVSSRC